MTVNIAFAAIFVFFVAAIPPVIAAWVKGELSD